MKIYEILLYTSPKKWIIYADLLFYFYRVSRILSLFLLHLHHILFLSPSAKIKEEICKGSILD